MIDTDILEVVRDHLKPGDIAVVTGASRGFGRAIAKRLAAGGAQVACWDVIEDEGAETVELCNQAGGQARFYKVDMGEPEQVVAAVDRVVKEMGVPYGVINNAGIHPRAKLLDAPLDLWERVIRVNLTGTFLCAREFVKHMSQKQRGSIVNLGSGRAIQGAVNGAHYAASKAGIVNLTKTMASEWAEYKIRVNAVIPGVSATAQPLEATTVDELLARGSKVPLGRIGHPDDIAGLVAFYMGPDSSNMTGQAVAINGGQILLPY